MYELEYGALRSGMPSQRGRRLEPGLEAIQQIPFDSDAAIAAANIRIDLEAVLVTNNTEEFSRVAGLRVTDWRSQ